MSNERKSRKDYYYTSIHSVDVVNESRVLIGLKPIKVKQRKCIASGCEIMFDSWGSQHRMCKYHRDNSSDNMIEGTHTEAFGKATAKKKALIRHE